MPTVESLLGEILVELKKLNAAADRRAASNGSPGKAGAAVAPDSELDSQYGDEEVRFTPRDWRGEPTKGRRMSQCHVDALDMLAAAFDSFAKKNDDTGAKTDKGKPKSDFDRRSAARARGWAARLRAGWKPAKSAMADDGPLGDTSDPFADQDRFGDAF